MYTKLYEHKSENLSETNTFLCNDNINYKSNMNIENKESFNIRYI